MSQDNKKKEYICPFCGYKMIVYESIESWLECSHCKFETQMHTCLGGAIAEFNHVNDELEKVAQFTLYGANEEDKVWKQNSNELPMYEQIYNKAKKEYENKRKRKIDLEDFIVLVKEELKEKEKKW